MMDWYNQKSENTSIGGFKVNSRNWVRMYVKTLLLGGIVTIVTGLLVRWGEFQPIFASLDVLEILSVFFWLFGVGLIFATISQMGFFAYLTVHRFGLGLFRSLWNSVQFVIIAFVLFDLVYFRFNSFAKEGESLWSYFWLAIFILIIGLIVGYMKSNQSNKSVFIPSVFFMVVFTTLEWIPVLLVNEESWIYLMLFPLIISNAYQILALPKYIKQSEIERKAKQANERPATK